MEDLFHLQHYRLRHHRPMAMTSRAAQFSAFAALTGYDEDIAEAARLTDPRAEMSEEALAELDTAFQWMLRHAGEQPYVILTCFRQDARKQGGQYVQYAGNFRFYEQETNRVYLTDGTAIPANSICTVQAGRNAEPLQAISFGDG